MHIRKSILSLAVASVFLVGTVGVVQAATSATGAATSNHEGAKLASSYSAFAGSPANAKSMVDGLRTGSSISLGPSLTGPNSTAPSASVSPATGKMGYGNVNTAISLAKTSLAQQNISNPTPAQLASALNGVLGQRSQGMGWGQIAKSMGVTLGSVKSASHTDKARDAQFQKLIGELERGKK